MRPANPNQPCLREHNVLLHGRRWVVLLLVSFVAVSVIRAADERDAPRLISLAPSLTELVYALGVEGHLVGRSSACDYPADTLSVPVVGGFGRPNREALQGARPDVVIATDLEKSGLMRDLEQRGITALILPCESWADLVAAARAIGAALGEEAKAEAWVDQLEQRRKNLRAWVARHGGERDPPAVYVEVWGRPIMTAGGDAFLDEVIADAGGRNIGGGLKGRYQSVSSEWVIGENPDIILLAYMLGDMRPAEAILQRIGWASIAALRHDRLIDTIDPDLLLRPGPRLIDGAEQLAREIHAKGKGDSPREKGSDL